MVLTYTPDPIRPTRRGPDPIRPMYGSKEGGYNLRVLSVRVWSVASVQYDCLSCSSFQLCGAMSWLMIVSSYLAMSGC